MSLKKLQKGLAEGQLTISALDDGSGVVLDVSGEQLLEMNPTGLAIMQAIADGAENEAQVAELVVNRFDAPLERVVDDVRVFVRDVGLAISDP
jgi:hypothetical protein